MDSRMGINENGLQNIVNQVEDLVSRMSIDEIGFKCNINETEDQMNLSKFIMLYILFSRCSSSGKWNQWKL